MCRRFVTIWFRYLQTDWFTIRRPELKGLPFVLAAPDHGRMVITEANAAAQKHGIDKGTVVADARALVPTLVVIDDRPGLASKLLDKLGKWCIRFTPTVAIDGRDGLILDVSGCPHLWGGEQAYLYAITSRLKKAGYHVQAGIADTIGSAWAISRYGNENIIPPGKQSEYILPLPPASLRLDALTIELLLKLGLRQVRDFISIPRSSLRRRFGAQILQRIDEAIGTREEPVIPLYPPVPYQERLPSIEPIVTATGIEIALKQILGAICIRLADEQKGLREAVFRCYRIDGKVIEIRIGTHRPTHHTAHLYKLFELKLPEIEPALGIELFVLDALQVSDVSPVQEKLWDDACGLQDHELAELLDRMEGKMGRGLIHRFIPDQHYWPERSFRPAQSIDQPIPGNWIKTVPRPLQVLKHPELIQVTAPIPDYPPMLFRYKNKLHKIVKADGPERIEQEWWIQQGQLRDYYCVEDEDGHRYWLFRSGHYAGDQPHQWYIHGFFA